MFLYIYKKFNIPNSILFPKVNLDSKKYIYIYSKWCAIRIESK